MTITAIIKQVQKRLGLEPTGIIDNITAAAIRNYQLRNWLIPTGELDPDTTEVLLNQDDSESDISTDLAEQFVQKIHKYYLPTGEYVSGPSTKTYIFLHHTAGWNNPYDVVDSWATDDRGRIGTQFIIGGINIRTNDDTHDGTIVQCFDDENYAWHLGAVNRKMHTNSIGIEICNFGWLVKRGDKYYTYTNREVDPKYVTDIGKSFRGYQYWHSYTDKQLESLEWLLRYISERHNISLEIGLKHRLATTDPFTAFEYEPNANAGNIMGLLSHTNVIQGKYDTYPHPKLCELIMSL